MLLSERIVIMERPQGVVRIDRWTDEVTACDTASAFVVEYGGESLDGDVPLCVEIRSTGVTG
jgi:hypothetical protein